MLLGGDHMTVEFSRFAVPTITRKETNFDWFESLQKCLMWSQRAEQKPFVVVESNNKKKRAEPENDISLSSSSSSSSTTGESTPSERVLVCMDEGEISKKQKLNRTKEEKELGEEGGFDLEPWTKEEMEREILSLNEQQG